MKRFAALSTAALVTSLSVPLTAGPSDAVSPTRISRVQYDSPGTDTGSNASLNAEWVQITNYSHGKESLTGWT